MLISALGGFKSYRFYAYVFVLMLCFVLFAQGDLLHTMASSYAYLNGHFTDFYEYNKIQVGGNDYLPLLYIIFALWNLPIYLADLVTMLPLSPLEIAWSKLLIVVFFFATVKVLDKIDKVIGNRVEVLRLPAASIFATAPIAVFAVFIFSQYDIIGVFFTLLGFYFYLKKDLARFAWFFSIAISFKYFALAIYFPLILMLEKRNLHIVKLLLIGIFVTAVQLAIYWQSEVFRDEIFKLVLGRVSGASGPGLFYLVLYFIGCIYLYFKNFKNEQDWKRAAVFAPIAAYGLMFSAVFWHPQWIIIVMPFFALAYNFVKNKKLFAYVDILGMLAFVWICVNVFPGNVDATMINNGLLKKIIPLPSLSMSYFMPASLLPAFKQIFQWYLFFPIFIILLEAKSKKYSKTTQMSTRLNFLRFALGIAFFLIPALVCVFK